MRNVHGELRLSASDLMRFVGCRHATTLDMRLLEVGDISPRDDGAGAELLQKRGDEQERAHLDRLRAVGKTVIEIAKDGISLSEAVRRTWEAMQRGPDVIFQGGRS